MSSPSGVGSCTGSSRPIWTGSIAAGFLRYFPIVIRSVIPSDLDGLHCGGDVVGYASVVVRSSRPIWTGSIAARRGDHEVLGRGRSSRPIWTGSIAARRGGKSTGTSAAVIPSDLDGLHCGLKARNVNGDEMFVIPSDLDGLHCGTASAVTSFPR